jgi:hypothetical protein
MNQIEEQIERQAKSRLELEKALRSANYAEYICIMVFIFLTSYYITSLFY